MELRDINLDAIKNSSVLVVGDAMLDRYWFGDASRISPEAPVPVVKVTRSEDRLGGAANVARNAASLKARTSLLAIIGEDEAGNKIMDLRAISRCCVLTLSQKSPLPHLNSTPTDFQAFSPTMMLSSFPTTARADLTALNT